LRAGYYELAGETTITKTVSIIGEGMGKTIIITADDRGLDLNDDVDYVILRGFTIDGDAQTDGVNTNATLDVSNVDYALVQDIEVKNAGYYGLSNLQTNHSLFQNIYAHDNYSVGVHPGTDLVGRNKWNTYKDIYAWDNTSSGFDDRGSSVDPLERLYNVYDNIQCWDNGGHGIAISYQRSGFLSNLSIIDNDNSGLWLHTLGDFDISNCLVTSNGLTTYPGIEFKYSDNINFTNVIVKNNYYGIRIDTCNNTTFTSCQSYDDRETPLQLWGLYLVNTNTGISLLNCKLTPNKSGDIYNPAGAVVTIITEKKSCSSFSKL